MTIVSETMPFHVWMTIHGSMMFLAWGIFAPCGIYFARFMRDKLEGRGGWFPYHRGLMLLTVILSAAGSLIAFLACESHFNKLHKILGPIINTLMIVQMIGGIAAHANRDPNRIIRPLLNQVHRVFGGITLALGWINICIGVYDHPTWAVWLKWTGIIVYFVIIGAVFGRSEGLLRRRSAGQPIPTD